MRERRVLSVGDLPTYGFGSQSPMWWGTLAFITLEATGFALVIGSYFYLAFLAPNWPLHAPPPDLLPGTLVLVLLLVSEIPNHLLNRWAKKTDMTKVRIGLVVMCVIGFLPLIVRVFEFGELRIAWDTNAYGSLVWVLLGLHTLHLVTDFGDTLVLTALMFTRHGYSGRRFSDVSDNAFFWDFVVAAWVVLYLVIYWFPRLPA